MLTIVELTAVFIALCIAYLFIFKVIVPAITSLGDDKSLAAAKEKAVAKKYDANTELEIAKIEAETEAIKNETKTIHEKVNKGNENEK